MLYSIVGSLIRLGTRQFFKELVITGTAPENSRPLIVAANHPNQAVDPFLVGTAFKRPLYFLAKSTLFKNPILGAFFRAMHMIPVYRRQDNSDTAKNDEMFSAAAAAIEKGYAIAIFPEGTSREERQLLPLKTGAARLAFYAVGRAQCELHLAIQPVGITYLSPRIFQSAVTISIGPLLEVDSYLERHRSNPQDAVHALTTDIEAALKSLTVHVRDLDHQALVENITFLFGEEGDLRERMQLVSDYVQRLAPLHADERATLESALRNYRQMRLLYPSIKMPRSPIHLLQFFVTAASALITGFVPYKLTDIVTRILVKDPHNLASIKIGSGLILYGIWNLILATVTALLLHIGALGALVFFLIFIIGAISTNRYLEGALGLIVHGVGFKRSPDCAVETLGESLRTRLRDMIKENAP